MSRIPLLVEFVAGPGTGKSTTATGVFSRLKRDGHNVEYVPEVAKDLTWEGRHKALSNQPYIVAKQMHYFDRLKGEVDAIITDTSTLLSLHHGTLENGATPAFREWVLNDHRRRHTLTIFLARDPMRQYNAAGRREALEEAVKIDGALQGLLDEHAISHYIVPVEASGSQIEKVASIVESRLSR